MFYRPGFHIFLFDLLEDFHQESSETSPRLPEEEEEEEECSVLESKQVWKAGFWLLLFGLGLGPYFLLNLFPPLQNGDKCYLSF